MYEDGIRMNVQLQYDKIDCRLSGTLGDEPVEWQHLDPDRGDDQDIRRCVVSGRVGAAGFEASWTSGDNYVPEPGGWTPSPDYVSDFPNIPAHLTGSFGGLDAELRGVFHLNTAYVF